MDHATETQRNQDQAGSKRFSRDLNTEYLASFCLHISKLPIVCLVTVTLLLLRKILESILMLLLFIFTLSLNGEEIQWMN